MLKRRPKTLSFVVSGILCLAFIVAWTSPSFAEDFTLSLSSEPVQGSKGQTVDLDMTLSYPVTAPSAFQLDIGFDTDVLTSPSATEGTVLTAAGKTIDATQPDSGVFRMIVSGSPSQIIGAGEAAIISFEIKSDAPLGETDVTLSNLEGTWPDHGPGDPYLEGAGNDGSIEVVAAIPTLSEWGVIIFMTIMMGIGVMILRKKMIV